MGSGLVEESAPSTPKTYKEIFDEVFPYYLSIGMTYEQFWDMDACLVRYYREAEKLRNEKKNQEMWVQGIYFRSALESTVGNMFKAKGADPITYLDAPIPLNEKQKEIQEENKAKKAMETLRARFSAASVNLNMKFEKEKADNGGSNN